MHLNYIIVTHLVETFSKGKYKKTITFIANDYKKLLTSSDIGQCTSSYTKKFYTDHLTGFNVELINPSSL